MCGAINRSFINTHFLLSAYFLTAQTYMYKHMCLITRVYGIIVIHDSLLEVVYGLCVSKASGP